MLLRQRTKNKSGDESLIGGKCGWGDSYNFYNPILLFSRALLLKVSEYKNRIQRQKPYLRKKDG